MRGLFRAIAQLLRRGQALDKALLQELEEALVTADVSVRTAGAILEDLRQRLGGEGAGAARAEEMLKEALVQILSRNSAPLHPGRGQPALFLMVGANGTGKTTTIAKLAARLKGRGLKPLLSASDTFRAAAIEQLEAWARRLGVETVRHQYGADPAAVLFDSVQAARARRADCVIVDTAGRLHTKRNLMEELRKTARVAEKALGRPPDETLLVLDATTGQNALLQAKEFSRAVPISGIVLTKVDGTAKGGTIITIADETSIPIKLLGTGERLEDLEDFQPRPFVERLFGD